MGSIPDAALTYSFIKRFVMPFENWPAYKAGIIDKDGNVLKKRDDLTPSEERVWGSYDLLIANMKKLMAKLPGGKSRLNLWAALALLLKEGTELDPQDVDVLKEKLDIERSKLNNTPLYEGVRFRSAFANEKTPAGWMKPHKVDAWHQSRANGWCVQVLDKHGNQVGDAEYHYHKKDAMHARKQLMKHHNLSEDAAVAANAVGPGHIAGTHEAGDDPPVRKKAWDKYKRKNKKFGDMPFARRSGANNG
jgi:hypothetical protein